MGTLLSPTYMGYSIKASAVESISVLYHGQTPMSRENIIPLLNRRLLKFNA